MSDNDLVTEIAHDINKAIEQSFEEAKAEKVRLNTPISYWGKWFPGFQYSPRQFYASVEQKLRENQIPNLGSENIVMKQGGMLSAKRLYLRFTREKLVFEICAAPFGTGFFVSSRFFDRRRLARWYHVLLAFMILVGFVSPFYFKFGLMWAVVIFLGVLAMLSSLMRLAASDVIPWLSHQVPEAPLLGRIYETYFNPDTFFRQDTNACYRTAVHEMVMDAIDDMTSQHGIRRLTEEERRLILHEH